MSIYRIGKNWKDRLMRAVPEDHRIYVGFRQKDYPPVSGSPTYETVDADVYADWRMLEGTGTEAGDRSRNRLHLTGVNTPTWVAGPTAVGGYAAALAAASSQYFRHPTAGIDTWDGTTPRAFLIRFKTSDAATQDLISQRLDGGTNQGYELRVANGDIFFALDGGATLLAVHVTDTLDDGEDHTCIVRYDGSQAAAGVRIRIDGAAGTVAPDTDTLAASCYSSTAILCVGARNAADRFGNGTFCQAMIVERELTDDECAAWEADGTFNQPGSHILTSGTLQYLVPLPSTGLFTLTIKARSRFAYDVATDQMLFYWGNGDAAALSGVAFYYESAVDAYRYGIRDGGTLRVLESTPAETADTIDEWAVWTIVSNPAGGQTACALYRDGVLQDADLGGAPDSLATQQQILVISAAAYDIAYVEVIPGVAATAADVANNLRDVLDERIYWDFNGHAVGRSRNLLDWQDVSADGFGLQRRAWGITERYTPAALSVQLANEIGQYSDDQFAAWDPANKVYNGTSAQRYLQQRPSVWCEVGDGSGNFEPIFVGRLGETRFTRQTRHGAYPIVEIVAQDMAAEIQRHVLRDSIAYDSNDLSDPTESNSILHKLVREGSQGRIVNYASNSSFENATIGNSWVATSGGAIVRAATTPLLGTYSLQLTNDASGSGYQQTILFTGDKKLEVGKWFTFTVYGRTATTQNLTVTLAEADSGGTNASTAVATEVTGGAGSFRLTVSHQITDQQSDRLVISGAGDGNVLVSIWDLAMLTETREDVPYFVLNSDDGAAAVYSADDAAEDRYDLHGFDVEQVNLEHPYKVINAGASLWDEIGSLADASIPHLNGFGPAGDFVFKCRLSPSYVEPAIMDVLTTDQTIGGAIQIESMVSCLRERTANRIVVRGPSYLEVTGEVMLWSALYAEVWDLHKSRRSIRETLAAGEVWPAEADYPGGFWAAYSIYIGLFNQLVGVDMKPAARRHHHGPPAVIPGEPPPLLTEIYPDSEIVMVRSPRLSQQIFDFGGVQSEIDPIEITVFDTDTRPGYARFQLTNDSGATCQVFQVAILGLPIYRVFGRFGYIHDSLIDHDHIRLNGDMPYEMVSDYLVHTTQIKAVAYFAWKQQGGANASKHMYQPTIPGLPYWLEPGARYRLVTGAAGTTENVDVIFDAARLNIDVRGNFGELRMDAFETLQNFTEESNAETRFLAAGGHTRWLNAEKLLVAPSSWGGQASIYCNNLDDDEQIQEAIDEMATQGGGVVELLDGGFSIGAPIVLAAGVTLRMGSGVVITPDGDFDVFQVTGGSGTEVVGAVIEGGTVEAALVTSAVVFDIDYADDLKVIGVTINGGINGMTLDNCDGFLLQGNKFYQQTQIAIQLGGCSQFLIDANFFDGGGTKMAVAIRGNTSTTNTRGSVINNVIQNLSNAAATSLSTGGVVFLSSGAGMSVQDNSINNTRNLAANPRGATGIVIHESDGPKVVGNTVTDVRNVYDMDHTEDVGGIVIVNVDRALVNGNEVADCDKGIYLETTGSESLVTGNSVRDSGQLIRHGGCEEDEASNLQPLLRPDTGPPQAAVNATWTRSNTFAYSGTYSYRLLVSAGGSVATAYLCDTILTTDMHGFSAGAAGRSLRLKARCYVVGPMLAAEAFLIFEYYNAGAWVTTSDSPAGVGAWEELVVDVTIPSTATGIRAYVQVAATASTNETVHFDEFELLVPGAPNHYNVALEDLATDTYFLANSFDNPALPA